MRKLVLAAAFLILPSFAHADSCADLRRACLYKERLGEVGEGNCKHYRERCRPGFMVPAQNNENRCNVLRRECLFQERLGELDKGNCIRYRATCK
jgi:hypothetical protein